MDITTNKVNVDIKNENKDVKIEELSKEVKVDINKKDVKIKNESKQIALAPTLTNVELINNTTLISIEDKKINVDIANNPIMIPGPRGPIGPPGLNGTISNLDTLEPIIYNEEEDVLSLSYGDEFEVINSQLRLYVSPVLTLSSNYTLEKGDVLEGVNLSWVINKPVLNRVFIEGLDLQLGAGQNGSYQHNININNNRRYTLRAIDNRNSVTSSVDIIFTFRRYWGVSNKLTINDGDILSFSSELAFNRNKTWTQDGEGKYIYYCYPKVWGEATFNINGLLNTSWTKLEQTHINSFGISELYNIYRTNTIQFGNSISIRVS